MERELSFEGIPPGALIDGIHDWLVGNAELAYELATDNVVGRLLEEAGAWVKQAGEEAARMGRVSPLTNQLSRHIESLAVPLGLLGYYAGQREWDQGLVELQTHSQPGVVAAGHLVEGFGNAVSGVAGVAVGLGGEAVATTVGVQAAMVIAETLVLYELTSLAYKLFDWEFSLVERAAHTEGRAALGDLAYNLSHEPVARDLDRGIQIENEPVGGSVSLAPPAIDSSPPADAEAAFDMDFSADPEALNPDGEGEIDDSSVQQGNQTVTMPHADMDFTTDPSGGQPAQPHSASSLHFDMDFTSDPRALSDSSGRPDLSAAPRTTDDQAEHTPTRVEDSPGPEVAGTYVGAPGKDTVHVDKGERDRPAESAFDHAVSEEGAEPASAQSAPTPLASDSSPDSSESEDN